MAIRTPHSDGYQQVELTQPLHPGQSGVDQQVIETVPCTKHLPYFFAILLADVFMFGSIILFATYAIQFAGGFTYERTPELPHKQLNLHALIMLTALVYLNGQAITVYKANYLVKHKSLNMLYHFVLQCLITIALAAGLFMSYEAQEASQAKSGSVSHWYSAHSWVGLIAAGLFVGQVSWSRYFNRRVTIQITIILIISLIRNQYIYQNMHTQFLFGLFGFLVTLCCRKSTARLRARAQPVRKILSMLVLCVSVAAVVSGLTQLARFELDGQEGRELYKQMGPGGILINTTAVSVIAATILIFTITFTFKRRQAHDMPVLFKSILLVTQFVELILMLVIAEFILQLVTPHINRAINSNFIGNTSLSHIFGNATDSMNQLINTAKRQFSSSDNMTTTTTLTSANGNGMLDVLSSPAPTIQLGPVSNLTSTV